MLMEAVAATTAVQSEQDGKSKDLLLAHLSTIEKIARAQCRRRNLPESEGDEFVSWLIMKLVENRYAVIRKFSGRGHFVGYLRRVITNALRDYCDHCWGKWRPSVVARQHQKSAVTLLERLYCRDRIPLRQAIALVLSRHSPGVTEQELWQVAATLPDHPPRRSVPTSELGELAARNGSEESLEQREKATLVELLRSSLHKAWGSLSREDATILERHYLAGQTIAQIASSLGLQQRGLYSRRDRCLATLRQTLEAEGVGSAKINLLLDWEGLDLGLDTTLQWTGVSPLPAEGQ